MAEDDDRNEQLIANVCELSQTFVCDATSWRLRMRSAVVSSRACIARSRKMLHESRRRCLPCFRGGADLLPDASAARASGRSFDRLAAVVESSDDAIITKTPQGTITSWNRAATRMFGYDSAEAIGRHITMLFPRERLAEEDEFMARIAHGERLDHFETERLRKDGTRIAVSITLSPVKDPQGRIVEISHIARDITGRNATMAALASEIETTRALFDSAAEGIMVVNDAGQIMRVNLRLAQMFGYAHGELMGQRVDILLPERFRTAHRSHRMSYFAAPRARSMGGGLDLFGCRKDGVEFPVEISLSPIETANGRLAMALVTDISERRSLEQATRQREKLATLATLSAGIAHELNNPIGIISTRIELMLQEAASHALPDQVMEDLKVLHRNVQRVTAIAKGLLSFARQAPDEPLPLDVNAVIEETLLLLGRPLAKQGVQIKTTLDRTLGPIVGNGNALQQVLTNLLLNARDAMPRGGDVRIETAPEPDRVGWLRIIIVDTGDGMRPETVDRIWEPFYTTKTSGTGLGLSVAQKIIREHGGAIAVESAPGRGTTFTIVLPVHLPEHSR
jgi:two-component system, cell cycle sensor histidine kinase and response regulator CckA